MDKRPAKKPFKVRHKKTGVVYTFVCVHDPRSERYGFSNVARPFEKLITSTEMDEKFEILEDV